MKRSHVVPPFSLPLVLLLAACGGGGGADRSPTTEPAPEPIGRADAEAPNPFEPSDGQPPEPPEPDPVPAPDPFSDPDTSPAPGPAPGPEAGPGPEADSEPGPESEPEPIPESVEPAADASPIAVPADLFERDGYGTLDVLRVDIRTVTTPGTCTVDDQSGCTLADVIADTDPKDDLKVDIPVHFVAADFPEDGRETNAEMRQRGASSRQSSRKSFRVELKGKGVRWRGEDKLQINKHPYDPSLIRNKLSFDLMARIPHLASSRTQFVNLWIDDGEGPVDYGVFTHDEAAGKGFLERRGWDTDGRLYKAEKFLFSSVDLDYLAIDEDGEPLDEDRFEERLEIENGEDHRPLHAMVRALRDPAVPFETVMERHFDEENVLTYVATNILLRQPDATTHNFYLYNPAGTERFYYVPWDYDYAFGVEEAPEQSFETDALAYRLFYGFGKVSASQFLKAFYKQPGFHERVLAKAAELRRGPLSDATIADLAERYTALVAPVAARGPERYKHKPEQAPLFDDYVAENHRALEGGYLPFPPNLGTPDVDGERVRFGWSPAHDVTERRTIAYDLEIATSPEFGPGDRVHFAGGIAGGGVGERTYHEVPLALIGSGKRYARLVARADEDPDRIWQIASNRTTIDGEPRIGMREFTVP